MTDKVLNLFQRLNVIKSKVEYVRKDKQVDNYKAVTHDAVTAETRRWFVEMGVLIFTSEKSSSMQEIGKTKSGNPMYRFEAKYEICFINCDEPCQKLTVELTSHANDTSDKAPGKAISYATKYAILKVLQLETGENEEARQPFNLAPGDEVDTEEIHIHLKAIEDAESMTDLQAVFKEAYTRASKDQSAQKIILAAKDKRKLELAGAK